MNDGHAVFASGQMPMEIQPLNQPAGHNLSEFRAVLAHSLENLAAAPSAMRRPTF